MPSSRHGARVVIASRIFLPEPAAASFRLAALANEFAGRGATVEVLTTSPPPGFSGAVVTAEGVRVRRAWVLRDRAGYVRGFLQYLSFDIPLFVRLLFLKRPDLVVVEPPPTTGWFSRIVCSIRRIPYVYYAADIWSDAVGSAGYPRYVATILRRVEDWAMSGADSVVSVSQEFTERINEQFPRANVVTVGNGVDTRLFAPEGTRTNLNAPYLLYAGTASEVHGAKIFLDAFSDVVQKVPQAKLVFIGQGSDFEAITERISDFPQGSVELHGRMSPQDVAQWIRGAQATLASVHPDGYARAFATKMYASVACGTPVIYAGRGPGAEFAEQDGIGRAVDYDRVAIADAMISALLASESQAQRTSRSEWAVENISLDAVASRIVDATWAEQR